MELFTQYTVFDHSHFTSIFALTTPILKLILMGSYKQLNQSCQQQVSVNNKQNSCYRKTWLLFQIVKLVAISCKEYSTFTVCKVVIVDLYKLASAAYMLRYCPCTCWPWTPVQFQGDSPVNYIVGPMGREILAVENIRGCTVAMYQRN